MWWQDTTSNRFTTISRRGDELRAEAAAVRDASPDEMPVELPGEIHIAVSGRHFHFGSIVIVFGRMLREEDHRRVHVRA